MKTYQEALQWLIQYNLEWINEFNPDSNRQYYTVTESAGGLVAFIYGKPLKQVVEDLRQILDQEATEAEMRI